jgi:hypothetical protein
MRTSAKPDFRKRRETDFWRTVNRLMIGLIVVGGIIIAALAFYPEFRKIEEMKSNIANLKSEVAAEQLLMLKQQREENWLKTDPEYVEILAREKLGVMKEGETVIRLDLETSSEPSAMESVPEPK